MERKKGVAIYGSTGSIGVQSLETIKRLDNMELVTIVCNKNIALFEKQMLEYKPKYAVVIDGEMAYKMEKRLGANNKDTVLLSGPSMALTACTISEVDTVINATVGISGLIPTREFIVHGKDVALANKESLVTGGNVIMDLAGQCGVKIHPIDSEHSAIWQCLRGNEGNAVERLIITASGGPFLRRESDLDNVTVEEALNHPTWKMGGRITIDSATLMNKGFEVIEAKWLFDMPPEKIKVLIHPQSVIHSMVQFADSSVMAQMGKPDMRLPIQYALTYPKRPANSLGRLDLVAYQKLEFYEPDMGKFKCLDLAFRAMARGGTAPAILNGADEEAVGLFLKREIKFTDIPKLVEGALTNLDRLVVPNPKIEDILAADSCARLHVLNSAASKGMLRNHAPNDAGAGMIGSAASPSA
ncbi:MAG: 1-deoxy-D-xylulose-5-phosphate reductoisomerase [Candidatus Micrarchaeaceae archaeon]